MNPSEKDSAVLARRGLLIGAGAAAVAAATLTGTGLAHADGGAAAGPRAAAKAMGTPVASTAGSAPISGMVYRHVAWMDFSAESGSERRWSSNGVYASADDTLWASVEIPAGALVRDIEWYAYSTTPRTALARIWRAGLSTLYATLADTAIPASSTPGVYRTVVPAASYGPHPIGTKIALGFPSRPDGSAAVSGARIGFTQGSGSLGLLPAPKRVYDSRTSGGKIGTGSTRTITLPASVVPVGATAVLVNVTAAGASGSGYFTVYPANAARPSASTLNYGTSPIANAVVVGVTTGRQIKIYASRSAHVILDITAIVG